jgi:hypothetical protein
LIIVALCAKSNINVRIIERNNIEMKVFISWSGSRSKKVALIFRDWLPSVIQSLEPFVSSEDIDKGSRWNTEIAQELKESTFGIICVTKDNLSAPWLNFEAGALSKTIENNFVAPFLFDVKPSELKGLPISQFQATSFSKEDLRRLMGTLNAAVNNLLPETRLLSTFDIWYPVLEGKLNDLRSEPIDETSESLTNVQPDLLEELLEMTRNTQRLLGNTDVKLVNNFEQLQKKVEDIISWNERLLDVDFRRNSRKFHPMILEDLLYSSRNNTADYLNEINLLIFLSLFRTDFPWLYDAGSELIRVLHSNISKKEKAASIEKFNKIVEYTCDHPTIRELLRSSKESMIMLHDLPMMIMEMVNKYYHTELQNNTLANYSPSEK